MDAEYILDKSPVKDKFAPWSKEGVFVGYSNEAEGFRVWLRTEKRVIVARDVKFLNEFTDQGNENKIISEKTEDKYEWMETYQKFETLQEEHLDSSNESNNENIEKNILEQVQPQIEMKRGPGRPKKIYIGQRGRPKWQYNYVSKSNQPNDNKDAVDNMNSSTDNNELSYDAGCQFIQANVCEIDPKIALQGDDSNEWKDAIY